MGTACAWPVVRWAQGTFRSSAALYWTPHLVPRKYGYPVCWPNAKRVDQVCFPAEAQWLVPGIFPPWLIRVGFVTAMTHPRDCRDCHGSWLPWLVPPWLIRILVRPGLVQVPSRSPILAAGWHMSVLVIHKCRHASECTCSTSEYVSVYDWPCDRNLKFFLEQRVTWEAVKFIPMARSSPRWCGGRYFHWSEYLPLLSIQWSYCVYFGRASVVLSVPF